VAIEQRGGVGRCPFNGEQAALGGGPAGCRKAAVLPPAATTRWHGTMIGQGFWPITSPTPRASGSPSCRRNPTVGEGRAGLDRSAPRVDAAIEFRHAAEVEHNIGKIAGFTGDHCHDAVDGAETCSGGAASRAPGWRRRSRPRMAPSFACRELHPDDPRTLHAMAQRPIAVSNRVKKT